MTDLEKHKKEMLTLWHRLDLQNVAINKKIDFERDNLMKKSESDPSWPESIHLEILASKAKKAIDLFFNHAKPMTAVPEDVLHFAKHGSC